MVSTWGSSSSSSSSSTSAIITSGNHFAGESTAEICYHDEKGEEKGNGYVC